MIEEPKQGRLISVVMPVCDSEAFLREAIESVLKQTFRDFELLVIYDKSTDGTLAILERYRRQDPRVRVIEGNGNGLTGALNQGFDAAQGKYIARMDADDISHPERLDKQLRLMESVGADVCGCHWLVINEEGKLTEAKIAPLCKDAFTIFLVCGNPFAHGSVMIRTDFMRTHLLRYGGTRCAEDYDLWTRFWEQGAVFSNVDDFLYKYRDRNGSLSKGESKENAEEAKKVRRRFVRNNLDRCRHAILNLTRSYATLSEAERVFLLLASWLVSITARRPIVIDVARHSTRRSIGVAMLYLVRGF